VGRLRQTPLPPPLLRTNRTRRIPHPVLIGHAASLTVHLALSNMTSRPTYMPSCLNDCGLSAAVARARPTAGKHQSNAAQPSSETQSEPSPSALFRFDQKQGVVDQNKPGARWALACSQRCMRTYLTVSTFRGCASASSLAPAPACAQAARAVSFCLLLGLLHLVSASEAFDPLLAAGGTEGRGGYPLHLVLVVRHKLHDRALRRLLCARSFGRQTGAGL
jgi:hypothetical protein